MQKIGDTLKGASLAEILASARKGETPKDEESVPKRSGLQVPNTTQVPNEILDQLLPVLKESELKVLLYLTRKTFGYTKLSGDRVPLSQIIHGTTIRKGKRSGKKQDGGTGLSRRAALAAIGTLERAGLIEVTRGVNKDGTKQINSYRLTTRESYEE